MSFHKHPDKVEMRKYHRLSKVLKTQYALVPKPGDNYDLKKAESINISAGGMKLLVAEYIEPGRQLVLQFILTIESNYRKLHLLSTVRRSDKAPEKGLEQMFYVVVEFENIRKNDLDIILKYTKTQKLKGKLLSMLTQGTGDE
jgi:c-di-GMP-binding flagellar brake protein YcgR